MFKNVIFYFLLNSNSLSYMRKKLCQIFILICNCDVCDKIEGLLSIENLNPFLFEKVIDINAISTKEI